MYELYCDGKDKDVKIERVESEKKELLNQIEEKDRCIASKNERITELVSEKYDLEGKLYNSNNEYESIQNENIKLKEMVAGLQEKLSKTLDFCESVKNSMIGKNFFKNQIKELSSLDEDKSER